VEEWDSEPCGHFTLDGLVALLPQVLNLFYVFSFQDKRFSDCLAGVVLVRRILAVAEHTIVHPAKTRNLVFVVEKLQFKSVGKWACGDGRGIAYLGAAPEVLFLFHGLRSLLWNDWNWLGLYLFGVFSVRLQCIRKTLKSHKLVQLSRTNCKHQEHILNLSDLYIKNGWVFWSLQNGLKCLNNFREISTLWVNLDNTVEQMALFTAQHTLEEVKVLIWKL
jgi:hypothetical protein